MSAIEIVKYLLLMKVKRYVMVLCFGLHDKRISKLKMEREENDFF